MQPRQDATDAPERARTRRNKQNTCALECLTCRERYSREDVLSGLYQIVTKVCSNCYGRMQASPHNVSCFGKPTTIMPDGSKLLGYESESQECRITCPDGALCAAVVDPSSYNPVND